MMRAEGNHLVGGAGERYGARALKIEGVHVHDVGWMR